jgi:amino acid adenylation domain-containing protein
MKQSPEERIPSDLAARFAALSPARRQVLRQKLKEAGLKAFLDQITPRRATQESPVPLSFSQQRLWFLDQYEPNSSVYNIPNALRLKGSLNIGALQQSLDEIIRRHESLRTTFSTRGGEPVQAIAPSVQLSFPLVDLTGHPEGEREEEIQRLVHEEAGRPFDLSKGPLFRSKLLRVAEDDHVLLLTIHHIVSDGWSMGVLYRELSVFYRAFVKGEPSPLPELPIQYADFAVWQREWLQGEVLNRQLSYWQKQLEGIPAVLNLPTDRPRPAVQSFRGARQSFVLSKDLTEQLKALSRKESVTLFMTLLAAFQTLLYRYTGQEDIVVGSPIANRNRAEIEGLIGFFVNTLVLRSNFSDNPTFKELLVRVREMALEAYAHQDLPFEKLVEELKPERNLSHSPLFQVMFVLQNAPTAAWRFAGLTAIPVQVGADTAKFDLTLSMSGTEEGLSGSLQYSTDLFDAAMVARMIGHLQTLLEGIVRNPDRRITQLPILSQAEENQLLIEWNNTEKDYPKDKGIHQVFEQQVERTPDAVAVVFEDQQLTYRKLNRRANQVAHYLTKLGVGPEVLVGVCMERSFEMVIGLLGILKAGGAYVPLDPEYPRERLAFMLEDCRVRVLLTQKRLVENLPGYAGQLVCLDSDWQAIVSESGENPGSAGAAENVAYVIYTSGSTGRPKGVVISHGALCNHMRWMQDQFPLSGGDRVVQKTPFSFDASVWEFFAPLISGVPLVMARPGGHRDTGYLATLIAQGKVTVFQLVPSLLSMFLEEEEVDQCRCLRRVFCGGEAVSVELQDRVSQRLGVDVHNLYGPAEATIDATFWSRPRETNLRSVPIGRPVSNTQIYLLDADWNPVPVGITGEIYLGGQGLARGYWNRPGLTAERFLPNPFSAEPGSRLYRTGDLGRYRVDGAVDFLGRSDHQVKIRGFRIELGEIESVLSQHPAVAQSLVLSREDAPGDHCLVAYIVADGRQADESELRSFVRKHLPEPMAPSAFVFLDSLPLTPNGKVDRSALPTPDQGGAALEMSYVAPRTPAEKSVAEIWAEVLKVDRVGIHDNFFELGGHSLKATQVISRTNKKFQIQLPLRNLFETPTVAGLAESVQALRQVDRQTHDLDSDTTARREQGEI